MSQQRQTPIHTECDTDLHHNAHTHTQDNGGDTSAQLTTGRTAGKIYITLTRTLHPPQHRNTPLHHHCPPHYARTYAHARTGNGNGGTVEKVGF